MRGIAPSLMVGAVLAACWLGDASVGPLFSHVERGVFSLVVQPAAQTSPSNLVDMRVFGDFWPGITGEEALKSFGDPDHYSEDKNILVYSTPMGRVEVSHLTEQSGGEEPISRWYLVAVPSVEGVVAEDVLRLTSPLTREVFVLGANGRTEIHMEMSGRKVRRLTWSRSSDSARQE